MAALNRYTQSVFALSSVGSLVPIFGSLANGAPTQATNPGTGTNGVQSLSGTFGTGWSSAVLADNSPALDDLNSLFYNITYQLAYILERGIPQYDAGTTYYQYDIVQYSGVVYQAIYSSTGFSGQTPGANATYWAGLNLGNIQIPGNAVSYTALPSDIFVEISGTSTQTLPDATKMPGQRIEYVKTDSNASTVTFDTQSSQTISGQASGSLTLTEQYSFFAFRSDGSNWWIVAAG